jgi:hypothetical protein
LTDENADKIKSLLGDKEAITAGRLKLLGLDEVREAVGDRWEKLKPKILSTFKSVVERRLAPSDVVISIGEAGFIILFGELSGPATEVKSQAIAKEARERLLGLDSSLEPNLFVGRETVTLSREQLKSLTAAAEVVESPDAADEADTAPDIASEVSFSPIWDVQSQAIISFSVEPTTPFDLYGAAQTAEHRRICGQQDITVMEHAVQSANYLVTATRKRILVARICATSFSKADVQSKIMTSLQNLVDGAQPLLTVEIVETRLGTSSHDVEVAADIFRGRVRRLALCTDLREKHIERARRMGFQSVGVDLSRSALPTSSEDLYWLDDFCRKARHHGLEGFVRGVATDTVASAAICAGATHLAGAKIGQPSTHLPPPIRFSVEDVIDHGPGRLLQLKA